MHWVLWILVSNLGIFWLEFVYRSARYGNFFEALPYIILPILMGQVGLYYGFRYGPSLFVVGTVFTLVNVVFRVANTYFIGEHLSVINWIGVVLLVVAMILIKVK